MRFIYPNCPHQSRVGYLCAIILIIFLSSCGSNEDTAVTAKTIISGKAIKGPIEDGTVTVFELTEGTKGEILGSTNTDTTGNFQLQFDSYTGPIILEVKGGTYINEALGSDFGRITLSTSLTAITNITENSISDVVVTPLTTLSTQLAKAMLGGITSNNIESANAKVGEYFGGINILNTQPINPMEPESGLSLSSEATQDAINYGLILAGISQQAALLNIADPMILVDALAQDISDGTFDGKENGSTISIIDLESHTLQLNNTAGTYDLATAISIFSSDTFRNVSGSFVSDELLKQLQVGLVISPTLSVSKYGLGEGSVIAPETSPSTSIINCGETCNSTFIKDQKVTLHAVPSAGSTFSGWFGACSGTAPCTLTMDGNKSVRATFNNANTITPKIITSGKFHTCIALLDDKIHCWGENFAGQLGGGAGDATSMPVIPDIYPLLSGQGPVQDLTAGEHHTCALFSDTVFCWIDEEFNTSGQGGEYEVSWIPWLYSPISQVTTVAAGDLHNCAVRSTGKIYCWGANTEGQLGAGFSTNAGAFFVKGISTAIGIAAGGNHSCALIIDGTVWCWGESIESPHSNSVDPIQIPGINTATAISAGKLHTCALLEDGKILCWGSNQFGQRGNADVRSTFSPVEVPGITTATAIAAGSFHTCAILINGTARCWGKNSHGEIGNQFPLSQPNGTCPTKACVYTPIDVVGINTATGISAGASHTCATLSDNTVRCWGDNFRGQLGDGIRTPTKSAKPIEVTGVNTATAISSGVAHTCALLSSGTVQCWGGVAGAWYENTSIPSHQILPDHSSATPFTIPGISTATAISAGSFYSCALLSNGSVQCWGDRLFGNTVHATDPYPNKGSPVTIPGISTAISITVGGSNACALLIDGTIRCWGETAFLGSTEFTDEFGDSTSFGSHFFNTVTVPVDVAGISTATAISAGGPDSGSHTCALLSGGTVQCWGKNSSGQINSGFPSPPTPYVFTPEDWGWSNSPGMNIIAISSGGKHNCFIVDTAPPGYNVACWGENFNGQTGHTLLLTSEDFGPRSPNLTGITDVSAGGSHSCAIEASEDGDVVWCWGANYSGQLGEPESLGYVTPNIRVAGITTAIAISAGKNHSCALLSDGTIRCWGNNHIGELGDGGVLISTSPILVSGFPMSHP